MIKAGGDREALKRLAVEAEQNLPPPTVVARLGDALFTEKSFREAERLLRAGQLALPGRFLGQSPAGAGPPGDGRRQGHGEPAYSNAARSFKATVGGRLAAD